MAVPARTLDCGRLVRVAMGATAILVLAGVLSLVGGPMGTLLRYSMAGPCPADAPALNCVMTLPGTVNEHRTAYDLRPHLTRVVIDIPGAPADMPRDNYLDEPYTWLTNDDAERLDLTLAPLLDEQVEVTLFDGEVVVLTGPNGQTAPTSYGLLPRIAAIQFLVLVLPAAFLFAAVLALWQFFGAWRDEPAGATGRPPSWLRAAVGTAVVSAVAGLTTIVVTSGYVAEGWTASLIGGAAVVAGIPTAILFARTRRQPVEGATPTGGPPSDARAL